MLSTSDEDSAAHNNIVSRSSQRCLRLKIDCANFVIPIWIAKASPNGGP